MRRKPVNHRFWADREWALHGQFGTANLSLPVRPRRAPKFGKQMLTPAMQAGIVSKRLSFRDIFTAVATLFLCVVVLLLRESCREQDESLGLAA